MNDIVLNRNKNIDLLKIIAITTMVIDHLRFIMPVYQVEFVAVGRVAFILFSCLLAYNSQRIFESDNKKSINNYFKNFLILAIISEIPYRILMKDQALGTMNIMFTLFLGYVAITSLSIKGKWYFKYPIFLFVMLFALEINNKLEYGFLGVMLIVIYYCYFNSRKLMIKYCLIPLIFLFAIVCNAQYYIPVIELYGFSSVWVNTMLIGCLLGAGLSIFCFSNKCDLSKIRVLKVGKWAWWFYPIHMLLIGFVAYLTA